MVEEDSTPVSVLKKFSGIIANVFTNSYRQDEGSISSPKKLELINSDDETENKKTRSLHQEREDRI